VKQLAAISFIFLFILQIGIKSLIVCYYHTVDTTTAIENCEYKTITVCKGNCYVAKKIKVITSAPSKNQTQVPSFELSTFKDAVCLACLENISVNFSSIQTLNLFVPVEEHYSFNPVFDLVKPPCA